MRKIVVIIWYLILINQFSFSQTNAIHNSDNPLQVKEYKLDNGLMVYLNEDHYQPNINGLVVVKGGSKRDPADATGIAHYLEHMLFKGTNKLGTIDYEKEKIYLDSIELKYEELGKVTDKKERLKIQKEINGLSLKASEYAIPNEFKKLLSEIGGTGINAFTNYDQIVYMNMFPANEIEKWLEICSHRFINPVFRSFQAELEVVYEEKNRSLDGLVTRFIDNFNSHFYKNHPYGQHSVLGDIDHIKNPSLRKMQEYYNTYYVANNMALILSGDFDSEKILPIIKEKFGKWKSGIVPEMPDFSENEFQGREKLVKRTTPIPVGIMGFRTVPKGHPDQIPLEICHNILSNPASTGLIDKLYIDNKILITMVNGSHMIDHGGTIIVFVPKLLRQSLRKADRLIITEIDKLKKGEFEEDLINAIKTTQKKYHLQRMESMRGRPYYIMDAFMLNKPWSDFLNYPDKIDNVSKQNVIDVANKYFGDNRFVYYSRTGFPKKDKIKKPPFKAIHPQNTEAKSEFAKELETIKDKIPELKFIEFNTDLDEMALDVKFKDIKENVHLYYSVNPMNDIFSLSMVYGVGKYKIPNLDYASDYLLRIGTEKHNFEELNSEFQKIGASYSIYNSSSYLTVRVVGLDENFEKTLQLVTELLTQMKPDEKQLKKIIQETRVNRIIEKKDHSTLGRALKQYAMYKDSSSYINRLSIKELKKISPDSLINCFKQALEYEVDIHYVGKKEMSEVGNLIQNNLNISQKLTKSDSPIDLLRSKPEENTIYFLDDKKRLQSHIYVIIEGERNDEFGRTISKAFNEYFGSGIGSVLNQEIREFNSLAYSCYAYYSNPFRRSRNGYLSAYVGTQSDKTIIALTKLSELFNEMPEKEERIEPIKSSLLKSVNSKRPHFRYISSSVSSWLKQGYNDDPRKKQVSVYKEMKFEDIVGFYENNIKGRPLLIAIAGDKTMIDMDELAKFGKIIEVSKKDLFK